MFSGKAPQEGARQDGVLRACLPLEIPTLRLQHLSSIGHWPRLDGSLEVRVTLPVDRIGRLERTHALNFTSPLAKSPSTHDFTSPYIFSHLPGHRKQPVVTQDISNTSRNDVLHILASTEAMGARRLSPDSTRQVEVQRCVEDIQGPTSV